MASAVSSDLDARSTRDGDIDVHVSHAGVPRDADLSTGPLKLKRSGGEHARPGAGRMVISEGLQTSAATAVGMKTPSYGGGTAAARV